MSLIVDTKNKIEPSWYTLESQKENDKPAEFKVLAVKGHVLDEILFGANFGNAAPLTAKGIRTALMHGIKGCQNVTDADGEEHKFTQQLLESLVWGDRQELAMAVVNKSKLTDEETKNS